MSIQLTEQQQAAIDEQREVPPRLIDPRTNNAYCLVLASEYEALRELLVDTQDQRAIRAIGLRNAGRRLA